MAKKSKKSKKPSTNPGDGLRDAVERTWQGASGASSGTQKRVQEVFDDFGSALVKLRETLDEKRVLDMLEALRDEVTGLGKRIASLERGGSSRVEAVQTSAAEAARNVASTATRKRAAKRKPAARKAAAKRKPAARKAAAKRKPAARKTAAKRKPAAARKTAAKRKPAARKSAAKPKPSAS